MSTLITPTQVNTIGDKLCAVYNSLYGSSASGFGYGGVGWGIQKAMIDLAAIVDGATDATFCDTDLQVLFAANAQAQKASQIMTTAISSGIAQWFNTLSAACGMYASTVPTVTEIASFLYYYNVTDATKWQCLQAPMWKEIFTALRGTAPNPLTVYLEVLQGATYTNALYKSIVGGAQTPGYDIDQTLYAGGFPYIQWTGGNGSGACSITVAGENHLGTVASYSLSGTWGAGVFTTDNTGVALVPAVLDNLITKVTSVTFVNISAGTFYVEARRPSGRSIPTVP